MGSAPLLNITVVVPVFNEAPNIAGLVRRLSAIEAVGEILFVDDSTDETPATIERVAASAVVPVRLIHRPIPSGGLGGAVLVGIAGAFQRRMRGHGR